MVRTLFQLCQVIQTGWCNFMKWLDKHKEKKEKKEAKWLDPYSIDTMSDEDFLENRRSLFRKSIFRIVIGIVMLLLVMIILYMAWGSITTGRWFI